VRRWEGVAVAAFLSELWVSIRCHAVPCRPKGCSPVSNAADLELMRTMNAAVTDWWTHDFFTCTARPSVAPRAADGLPAYPSPVPHNASALLAVASDGLRRCTVQLLFDTPDGWDPLTHSVSVRMTRMDRSPVVHLRWLSPSWWCSQPGVVALVPDMDEHPRHNCRVRPRMS